MRGDIFTLFPAVFSHLLIFVKGKNKKKNKVTDHRNDNASENLVQYPGTMNENHQSEYSCPP